MPTESGIQRKSILESAHHGTEAARRMGGFGLYRVALDLKTGSVTKATVIQSTGVRTLDDSAMKALRQWLWKPGKWKEVDVPVALLPFNLRPQD
jgi:TonB family protein